MQLILLKGRFPGLDQAHLADRGGSLQIMDSLGSPRPTQPGKSRRYCPGGNQNNLDTLFAQARYLPNPIRNSRLIQTPAVSR
jgi:hypothetical protein